MPCTSEYMRERRETNPLQYFQDKKDMLKYRICKVKKDSTRKDLIEEYAKAVLELDAARRLYRTR